MGDLFKNSKPRQTRGWLSKKHTYTKKSRTPSHHPRIFKRANPPPSSSTSSSRSPTFFRWIFFIYFRRDGRQFPPVFLIFDGTLRGAKIEHPLTNQTHPRTGPDPSKCISWKPPVRIVNKLTP